MEWQGQDTSLARKDAWTQTSPARRRIRHTQVQGAGKSICRQVGAREVSLSPAKGSAHGVGAGESRAGPPKVSGFKQSTYLLCDSFALDQ